ncbi:DNA polymerase alpha subunit B [Porphyridium purpureum]|uniref:DNA polymerase alpha subunit B n=1 Tax=Porphyridium purpureum TaxID=35688 RepID=A0A5J4Z0D5_PORPP|nr:DNA polymerase alpha subunit B [Porphyridium purpureum]|eukprot:POR0543..scf209_3
MAGAAMEMTRTRLCELLFGHSGGSDDQTAQETLLDKIVQLCSKHALSADEMFARWEALALEKNIEVSTPTMAHLAQIEDKLNKSKAMASASSSAKKSEAILAPASMITPVSTAKGRGGGLRKGVAVKKSPAAGRKGSAQTKTSAASKGQESVGASSVPLSMLSTDMFFDLDMYAMRDDVQLAPKNLARAFDDAAAMEDVGDAKSVTLDANGSNPAQSQDRVGFRGQGALEVEPILADEDWDISSECAEELLRTTDSEDKLVSFCSSGFCTDFQRVHRVEQLHVHCMNATLGESSSLFEDTHFRYMNDPRSMMTTLLRSRIKEVSERICTTNRCFEPTLEAFDTPTQQLRTICGRVRWELEQGSEDDDIDPNGLDEKGRDGKEDVEDDQAASAAATAVKVPATSTSQSCAQVKQLRANGNAVLLESIEGHCVKLDLSMVQNNLFLVRGQVVVLVGNNPTGRLFRVQHILDCEPNFGASLKPSLTDKGAHSSGDQAVSTGPEQESEGGARGSHSGKIESDPEAMHIDSAATEKPRAKEDLHDSVQTLRILSAAGPFYRAESKTEEESRDGAEADPRAGSPVSEANSKLNYGPLIRVLKTAVVRKAHVLVLFGPFLDANDAAWTASLTSMTYDEYFEAHIVQPVQQFLQSNSSPGLCVVLVPHIDDVHHPFVVPQPGFFDLAKEARLGESASPSLPQLCTAANPDILRLRFPDASGGEILLHLGVSSLPSIESISANSLCTRRDRIGEMVSYLMHQRHFFPIFPVPSGIPLDATLGSAALSMPAGWLPDVVINPSKLGAFVKPLGRALADASSARRVAINPGQAVRMGTRSYAVMDIQVQTHRDSVDQAAQTRFAYKVAIERLD